MVDYLTSALATLLVVADPIFLSAIFLGLTSNLTPKDRREVALRGSIIAFCILVAAGLGVRLFVNPRNSALRKIGSATTSSVARAEVR